MLRKKPMDDYLKFPLNQAHFLQRKAEKLEIKGQFEAAIENRIKALHNLEDVVKAASCPVIKETLELEINLENQKIDLLRRKSFGIEKLIKSLENHSIKMAQAKCPPMTLEIPSPNFVASSQDICDKLSDYSFKILQNTEKIESILNGLNDKLNFEKSLVTSRKDTNVLKDGHLVFVEELEGTVNSLKSHNVDNICLVKSLNKEVNIVKSENAKLKAKIRELELKNDLSGHKKACELLNGSGTSPFIVLPIGVEDMKSTDISIPDFPPLDCPSFDFLFKAERTISEDEKL